MEGAPFLQVKVSKGGHPLVEIVVTEGVVVIRCRECFRFHRVRVNTIFRDPLSMMDLQ